MSYLLFIVLCYIGKINATITTLSLNSKDLITERHFNNLQNTEKAFFINQSKELCNNLFTRRVNGGKW